MTTFPNGSYATLYTITVNTASGTTSAPSADFLGFSLVGIVTPSGLTSTSLKFNVNPEKSSGSFVTLKDIDGNDVTVTVEASKQYALDPALFASIRRLQIESGSSETDKDFTLILKPIA